MRTRQDDPFGEMLERQMKSEHHELFREISEATDTLISAVKSVCDPRFAAAGQLEVADVEELEVAFEESLGGVTSLYSRDMERAKKTAFRNEYAFERLRLHASPGDSAELSWLWTTNFYAKSKIVILENSRLPFAWSTHAMARMMQRGIAHRDPRSAIAKQVLESSFLISVAADLIEAEGLAPRFSVPVADGILAGFVCPIPEADRGSFRLIRSRDIAGIDYIGPAALYWRGQQGPSTTGWIGRTFIGSDTLGSAERQYIYDFSRMQRRYRLAAKEAAHLLITMTSVMKPPEELSQGVSESLREAYEEATAEMREFLTKFQRTNICGAERGNKRRRSWIEQREDLQREEALSFGM
ncbi:hypothetical protein OCUBac02_48420 (plasmid) [Bosea sp. ANAM02]|nr:hypothetical protein OCUBac02_48420 [Bosea sp. ANAM02]